MKIEQLKILSEVDPVGIDAVPYFSYMMTSDGFDVRQTSHSITVRENGNIVWSRAEQTDKTTFIPYGGELKSKTRYDVDIEATDNYGNTATAHGCFETAFLSANEWGAKWIKNSLPVFDADKGFGKQPPPTLFSKSFRVPKKRIIRARLYCTCHGVYIPSINGVDVTEARFAPGHSSYEKVLFYQTYDVTDKIKVGNNSLDIYVGDGWYLGVKTTPRVTNYERVHAVLFRLDIVFADGKIQSVFSDEDCTCAYGPVQSSDMFAGELYDARQSFDSKQPCTLANYGYDNLVAQTAAPVVCVERIPVKRIIQTPNGETVLDFGKVSAGRLCAVIDEPKDNVVTFTHSEVLDENGNFFQNTDMPDGGVEQTDKFISDGKRTVYEPLFTYHGFRYVKVDGVTKINPSNYTLCAYSSRKQNVGQFRCSDDRLNKLYGNIRNAQSCNMLSIPTDCPQREKAGWTGDIAVYARTALLNEDVTAFLKDWLLSVRADQGENGAIPIVVPYDGGYPFTELFFGPMFGQNGTIGSAGWGDACVLVPYALYRATGDISVIEKNIDVMEKWCGYILDRCDVYKKGGYLWRGGYHQGDWLVPSLCYKQLDMNETIEVQKFTSDYAAPLYGYNTFTLMRDMTRALGDKAKSDYYADIAQKMKLSIQSELFDENGDMPTDLMGAYVLAAAFDVVPKEHVEHVKNKLIGLLEKNGGVLDTGFLSTPYLLDAYCKIGRRDLAYELLFQTKSPSWLYQVERGATSVWESWDNYEANGSPKKISYNHYAYGCVFDWIVRNICGLDLSSAGYKTFTVKPVPSESLTFSEQSYLSVYGKIAVRWEKKDGKFELRCEVPCNTVARIIMPSGKSYYVGSGKYCYTEDI